MALHNPVNMLKSLVSKKTKKEKVLAKYHRKLMMLDGTAYKLPVSKEEAIINSASLQAPNDYSYVASDLRRIAILSALAICAQLVLWYRLR